MEIISTNNSPQAIGPYSQAVRSGNFLFCSGQIGLNQETMILEEGLEKQAEQICKNIGEILKESGLNYENVIKTTIYLTSIGDFDVVNLIYGKYFMHRPARSTVEVAALPKGALIEIEAVAEFI